MKLRRKRGSSVAIATVTAPDSLFGAPESDDEGHSRQERIDIDEARREAKAARRARVRNAREDVNEFCPFVGRDSRTGDPIVQELIHEDFQLLADVYSRLIVMAHPESGKTTQLAILRVLHKLGRNPNLRVAVVAKTKPKATKTTRTIKEYIEKSEELAEVFPDLLPSQPWSDSLLTVRRPTFSKDPSIQALGMDGGSPTGDRIDILILDDILDLENTLTEAERKKTIRRIKAAYLDRLSADGEVLFLTNAWHPDDAAHVFEKESAITGPWFVARFPIYDEDGETTWPAMFSPERIEEKRNEMGPLEFARAFLCRARDEGESPFDEDAIDAAIVRAREEGIDLVYAVRPHELPPGAAIYTGVDLAVTKKRASHLTALVTVLLWPEDLSRQVLWVEAGRWSTREIRDKILDHDKRYGSTFIVENNAAQRWIIDITYNQSDLPLEKRRLPTIVPFTTGKQKAHPEFGVEGVAAEYAAEKWLFPNSGPEAVIGEALELKGEMLYYTRGAHTGDRLMAKWFAREGCRRGVFANRPEREGPGEHLPAGGDQGGVQIIG